MKIWKESQDEVNKIRPDKEMAKSLLKMMEIRLKATESLNKEKFTSIVVEGYYEVIKEGITALMAIDGYKTLSHGFDSLSERVL
jgi:methyltransferase-like protein